ncbi:MAG TPA: alpha/beta hydrolase [Xanthomonadales bacterium]|nr:alpha/beta hydrolase [Xanthomonadales bacterium]
MSYTGHRYESTDGLSLYYRNYGAGDDVVLCLHGLTRNSKDFNELAMHLAARWRVICPDIRGRGQSAWDPRHQHYNPGIYAADAWRLMDGLGITRFAVIGTSLGGLVAMIMADQQAARLRGIVLNDIGPEIPGAAVARIVEYAGQMNPAANWTEAVRNIRGAYELALPEMPDAFWEEFTRLSYRENPDGVPKPDMDPAIGAALRKPPAIITALRWLNRHGMLQRIGGVAIDPWDSFRSISMPCLLLRGAISDVLTPEIMRKMCAVNQELEVVTVPGRGHAPLLDEPEALHAIDGYLGVLLVRGRR